MSSPTAIANLALQKLGAKRITSLGDNSPNARAVSEAYEHCVRSELQAHPWVGATKRVELAADLTVPEFGRNNYFPLPADYLRLLPADEGDADPYDDKRVEGRYIVSDYAGPMFIRYTAHITDVNLYHPLLIEAIACRLALQICEEITQSNAKKEGIRADHKIAVMEARRQNAFSSKPHYPAMDSWESVRY